MAKKETNTYLLAIVAIIAIVGIVVLISNVQDVEISDEMITGQAYIKTAEGFTAHNDDWIYRAKEDSRKEGPTREGFTAANDDPFMR